LKTNSLVANYKSAVKSQTASVGINELLSRLRIENSLSKIGSVASHQMKLLVREVKRHLPLVKKSFEEKRLMHRLFRQTTERPKRRVGWVATSLKEFRSKRS